MLWNTGIGLHQSTWTAIKQRVWIPFTQYRYHYLRTGFRPNFRPTFNATDDINGLVKFQISTKRVEIDSDTRYKYLHIGFRFRFSNSWTSSIFFVRSFSFSFLIIHFVILQAGFKLVPTVSQFLLSHPPFTHCKLQLQHYLNHRHRFSFFLQHSPVSHKLILVRLRVQD